MFLSPIPSTDCDLLTLSFVDEAVLLDSHAEFPFARGAIFQVFETALPAIGQHVIRLKTSLFCAGEQGAAVVIFGGISFLSFLHAIVHGSAVVLLCGKQIHARDPTSNLVVVPAPVKVNALSIRRPPVVESGVLDDE